MTCIGKKNPHNNKTEGQQRKLFRIWASNTSLNPDRVSKAFHVPDFSPAHWRFYGQEVKEWCPFVPLWHLCSVEPTVGAGVCSAHLSDVFCFVLTHVAVICILSFHSSNISPLLDTKILQSTDRFFGAGEGINALMWSVIVLLDLSIMKWAVHSQSRHPVADVTGIDRVLSC